jgi:hypothetical protein
MTEENMKKAREALERARALEPRMEYLRKESKRLAEETEVLERAEAILRSRRERAGQ